MIYGGIKYALMLSEGGRLYSRLVFGSDYGIGEDNGAQYAFLSVLIPDFVNGKLKAFLFMLFYFIPEHGSLPRGVCRGQVNGTDAYASQRLSEIPAPTQKLKTLLAYGLR